MDYRRLVNECPSVVGMLSAGLQSGGSLDSTVRSLAVNGPRLSRKLFEDVVRRTDTKEFPSISEGLVAMASALPKEASGCSRAIMMVISASESADDPTRNGLLDDASDLALEAVKEMGESYGESLTAPCMAVFGIGIMVPMIMMSILPMLSIGGIFGSRSIDQGTIVLITLVVVPAVILAVSVLVRHRNPFLSESLSLNELKCALPLLGTLPLAISHCYFFGGIESLFILSLAPTCIATMILMMNDMNNDRKRRKCEQAIMDSVFDIGNRMVSGENFETSVISATSSWEGSIELSERISREMNVCRGDVRSALHRSIDPISREMGIALEDILVCSEKNNDDAGRMAVNLGKQFQNRNRIRRTLELRLKSTTDMMIGTCMFFAPIVLGMSVSMLEPVSRISGSSALSNTSTILNIYLIELCALISVLLSSLGSGERLTSIIWRFCLMCPVSLLVFLVCSSFSL